MFVHSTYIYAPQKPFFVPLLQANEHTHTARQQRAAMATALHDAQENIQQLSELGSRLKDIQMPKTPDVARTPARGQGQRKSTSATKMSSGLGATSPEEASASSGEVKLMEGTHSAADGGVEMDPLARFKLSRATSPGHLSTNNLSHSISKLQSSLSSLTQQAGDLGLGGTGQGAGQFTTSLKQSFADYLCNRFGNLIVGWTAFTQYLDNETVNPATLSNMQKQGLDDLTNMRSSMGMSMHEFQQGCNDVAYENNVKMTFQDIAGSFGGRIVLDDLDSEG